MPESQNRSGLDHDVEELKASIDKYLHGTADVGSDAAADLTKAIHELSDHVVRLHRRVESIEASQEEWTTHGWMPPPGSDERS